MSKLSVEMVIGRLKEMLSVSSDSALARAMNTTPQTISSWKMRDSIPYAMCVNLSEKHNVSLDWLLTGKEPNKSVNEPQELTRREKIFLEMMNKLTEAEQQEILQDGQEMQRISQMEAELMNMKAEIHKLKKMG